MDKHKQLKLFHHNRQLQVYMYNFMCVDTETIPVKEHLTATRTFIVNYKNISASEPVPTHWLVFSYISSKDYDFDSSFDET